MESFIYAKCEMAIRQQYRCQVGNQISKQVIKKGMLCVLAVEVDWITGLKETDTNEKELKD